MSTPKLPEGFKWHLRKSTRGGYLLVLIPAEGYEWNFPRCSQNAPVEDAYFFTWLKDPKASGAMEAGASKILRESLGSTTIVKPKVRKIREHN